MEKAVFERILDLQESVRHDEEYQTMIKEHEISNERFLSQLETMNQEQQDAVMDYCGLLIEIQLKMLEYAVKLGA